MVQCAMLAVLLVLLPLTAAMAGMLSLEGAVSHLLDTTPVHLGSVQSATNDYERLKQCFKDQSCISLPCDGECSSSLGPDCRAKCRLNCACACDGLPGSSVDNVDAVDKCIAGRACSTRYSACNAGCSDDDSDCLFSCYLEELECVCGCNQERLSSTADTEPPTTLNPTSTPPASTTPTTTTPTTPPTTPTTTTTPAPTSYTTWTPPFWPNASPPSRPAPASALLVNLALSAMAVVFAAD